MNIEKQGARGVRHVRDVRLALREVPDQPGVHGAEGEFALRAPDFIRVVLHPAGLRVVLLEFALRRGDRLAGFVEDDGARTGGALVEGEDMTHVKDSNRADANIPRSMR